MSEKLLMHLIFVAAHTAKCSLESILILILMELRISPNVDGAKCLRKAILLNYRNPDLGFTKQIYPEVSLNGSGSQAEQAIRSVINNAWLNRQEETWDRYFIALKPGVKPSNRQFIETICLILTIYEDLRDSNRED